MLQKWCFFLFAIVSSPIMFSQTFSWSGFPDGGNSYSVGIMDVTVTSVTPGFQFGSPKYHEENRVGYDGCGIPGGLALEQKFGNLVSSFVQLELDFSQNNTSSGVCGDVSFSILDINANEYGHTFADWVEITAEDGNGTLIPVSNLNAIIDDYKTIIPSPTALIVRGTSDSPCGLRSALHCTMVDFKVTKPLGSTIKKVFIKYHPDYSFDDCDYHSESSSLRADFQYISVGEISIINSIGPTDIVYDLQHSCAGLPGNVIVETVTGGTPPYLFELNNSGATTNPDFQNLIPGNYELSVEDANGCRHEVALEIEAHESPTSIDYSIVSGNCSGTDNGGLLQISNVSNGQSPYHFSLDEVPIGTMFYGLTAGNHHLEVVDFYNCSFSEQVVISDSIVTEVLIIPNVFTPNSDNINGRWAIHTNCIKDLSCSIVNRWGQELRRLNNPDDSWDGNAFGEPVPEGVYFYNGEITFWTGEKKSISGTISIIR